VSRWSARLLALALHLGGLAVLVAAVYSLVVLGIGGVPTHGQWTLLLFSILAAAITALVYPHLRERLSRVAERLGQRQPSRPDDLLDGFGSRLTRAISLEELLLQLAESLRTTLGLTAAEVWTGSGGLLDRSASDPDLGRGSMVLNAGEQAALARGGVVGNAWLRVWLPQLVAGREEAELRAAPITHAGALLGLLVVERDRERGALTEKEEQVLRALARQVGLALSNARLDSALSASLEQLTRQADELRASRARVVAAADAERRRIERDLHDGAQQHLVGLAVNLRLARELAESDPAGAKVVLEELTGEVRNALDDFRDLAHGIYPPLLAERGLVEGLRAAIPRVPIKVRVEPIAIGRYSPEVEATVYFCCLEALQNAGKHAGPGARATLRLWEEEGGLRFEIADDGAGFDAGGRGRGAGLTNMEDRVGALGGRLSVHSAAGEGTQVAGVLPLGR
jgi:signal transduction histidine kinase